MTRTDTQTQTYIAELEARREERDEVGDARESTELSHRIRMLREGTPLDIDVRALELGDRRIPIRPATAERELIVETPAEELGRLRRELSELDPEWVEHRETLDRIAVLTREAAETRATDSTGPYPTGQAPEETTARFYVTLVSVGANGMTERPAVIDREYGRQVKVFRSNERNLAETMARTLNEDAAKEKAGPRDKVAELEVLERFDAKRRAAGHDYGAGQRRAEIGRRERELDPRYRLSVSDEVIETTDAEVLAAFERIARPRIARLEAEDFRRTTPATRRTIQTWERLERELRLSAKQSAELVSA